MPLVDVCIPMSGGSIPIIHFLVVISSTCMRVFLSWVPALQSCGLRLDDWEVHGYPKQIQHHLNSLQNVFSENCVKNTRNRWFEASLSPFVNGHLGWPSLFYVL